MSALGIDEGPAFALPHRSLWSLGYFIGNFTFMLCVNVFLYFNPAVPAEKRVGLMLLNSAVWSAAFVVLNVAILRRKLQGCLVQ